MLFIHTNLIYRLSKIPKAVYLIQEKIASLTAVSDHSSEEWNRYFLVIVSNMN